MNHSAFVEHEARLPYRRRAYFVWQLDDEHFDVLNNHLYCMCGYSLDAIEEIPAGSMVSFGNETTVGAIHYMPPRGVSLKEQQEEDAFVDSLIEELLAEERKE